MRLQQPEVPKMQQQFELSAVPNGLLCRLKFRLPTLHRKLPHLHEQRCLHCVRQRVLRKRCWDLRRVQLELPRLLQHGTLPQLQ